MKPELEEEEVREGERRGSEREGRERKCVYVCVRIRVSALE